MRERVIVQEWNKLGKPYDRDEWHLVSGLTDGGAVEDEG